MDQPRTIITLHDAEPADRQIWVTESPGIVRNAVATAVAQEYPLVTFNRVRGVQTVEFSTQPTNVMNVEQNA